MSGGSTRVARHVRSNVVGYVALFVALSGTAYAIDGPLAGQDTVGSSDVIDGEIYSRDVRDDSLPNGGLRDVDLRAASVGTSEIDDGALLSQDIGDGAIKAIDVGDEGLTGADIASNSIQGVDVDEPSLFNDNSLNAADLASGAVAKDELAGSSIGASEVGEAVIRRNGNAVAIAGGTEGNGAATIASSTASCETGEELISGAGEWIDNIFPTAGNQNPGDEELWMVEVVPSTTGESVTAIAANDTDAAYTFRAVALCLTL